MVMTREQINELRERQEKSGPSIATEFGPLLPPGRHSKERSTARSASNRTSTFGEKHCPRSRTMIFKQQTL